MTLVQYEYIVAVDDHRHFATAAQKCFVTQPTLSMQIQKLEEQLGVQIFDRTKQPVEPTEIGKKVIKQARTVLKEAYKIKQLIADEKGLIEGDLRIGIIPTLSPYLLPLFVNSFIESYRKVHLEVQELITDQIVEKMDKGLLDAGLFVTPSGNENLEEIPLFYEEFVAYVATNNHLYKKLELSPNEIDLEDVWVLNEGHCFRNQVINICKSGKSAGGKFTFECGSLEALKKLVDHQSGITLLPELATLDMSDAELEKVRTFADPVPVREVSLVVPKSYAKRGLVKALYESIKASIPDDISSEKSGKVIKWR